MKRRYSRVLLIGIPVLAFLIAFGVFIRLMMSEYFVQRNVLDHGSRAIGTITDKGIDLTYSSSGSELWYRITYTFTPPGWAPLTYGYRSGVDTGLKVGDQIKIAFDPANPALNFPVRYASKIIVSQLILNVFGALFVGGAVGGLALLLMAPLWEKR